MSWTPIETLPRESKKYTVRFNDGVIGWAIFEKTRFRYSRTEGDISSFRTPDDISEWLDEG